MPMQITRSNENMVGIKIYIIIKVFVSIIYVIQQLPDIELVMRIGNEDKHKMLKSLRKFSKA